MLKKTITYENPFTNAEVTEVHHFHISKADLIEMEMEEHTQTYTSKDGEELTGMRAKLQRIVDSQDGKAIIEEIRDIIRRSYGVKDGDRFRKSKEISEDFMSSEAFSQLLFDLCTDAENAAEFMSGVVPHNLQQIAEEVEAEAAKKRGADSPAIAAVEKLSGDGFPSERKAEINSATSENPVVLTETETRAMGVQELQTGLADGRYKLR